MSGQEKKRQRIYDLLNAEARPKFLCLPYTKQSFFVFFFFFFFTEKQFFKEKGEWRIKQKRKEGFLTVLTTAIKKEPITSIKKHASELEVHEKMVGTVIKRDLISDHNSFDYVIWDVLENKINTTSHLNIGSFTTTIGEEWNKMSEEIILKTCKSFRRRAYSIIEKHWYPYRVNLLLCVYLLVLLLFFFLIKINFVL